MALAPGPGMRARRHAWDAALQEEERDSRGRAPRCRGAGTLCAVCLAVGALVAGLWPWALCSPTDGCFRKHTAAAARTASRSRGRNGPDITPSMYSVDVSVLSARMASTFVPVARDRATDAFLAAAALEGESAARRAAMREEHRQYLAAQRRGMSRTDASAQFLNRTMLVATAAQFRALLHRVHVNAESLLDIGAGRGSVTASLAQALRLNTSQVTTMEASPQIRDQLRQLGFRAVEGFDELRNVKFGVVALLNVLDRTHDPRALLRAAANAMEPRGVLLVATVLPYCDMVCP